MKRTQLIFSLALLGSLSLATIATATETPDAQKVCAALTKAAKKQSGKESKKRLVLAAAIKRLEKEPGNVNELSRGRGYTPLMIATDLGEKDAVAWLISIGADPCICDFGNKDSLSRATDEEMTALLRKGALFSWQEVLAYLEASEDEACKKLLEQCRQYPANPSPEEIEKIFGHKCPADAKLAAFSLRNAIKVKK